jgi:hypothetical protein
LFGEPDAAGGPEQEAAGKGHGEDVQTPSECQGKGEELPVTHT